MNRFTWEAVLAVNFILSPFFVVISNACNGPHYHSCPRFRLVITLVRDYRAWLLYYLLSIPSESVN